MTPTTTPMPMSTPYRGTWRTVASTVWRESVEDMPLLSHRPSALCTEVHPSTAHRPDPAACAGCGLRGDQ
ncbi:hypothetical protein GCM10010489_07190 [Microbacterium saperdae]|nr:hypothetical protein GCM10010489_07190 [Microbacterium saperdae]